MVSSWDFMFPGSEFCDTKSCLRLLVGRGPVPNMVFPGGIWVFTPLAILVLVVLVFIITMTEALGLSLIPPPPAILDGSGFGQSLLLLLTCVTTARVSCLKLLPFDHAHGGGSGERPVPTSSFRV